LVHRDGHVLVAGGGNHWTKLPQMKVWRKKIVEPAVRRAAEAEGLEGKELEEAVGIVNIDAYSVHRDKEHVEDFVCWPVTEEDLANAAKDGPPLTIEFVPARCTGLYQIADVVINRPFKVFLQKRHTAWLIKQLTDDLQNGVPVNEIELGASAITEVAPKVMGWVLDAVDYCSKEINVSGALASLGYSSCFSDARLRRAGMMRLSEAGIRQVIPALDELQLDDDDYVDMGAADDDDAQAQFYAEHAEGDAA
jgi:hypothetical protein